MENETVRRAIFQFPHEPIVRYSWPNNRTEILFSRGNDALKATRYTVVKPVALIPDFTQKDETLEAEIDSWVGVTEEEIEFFAENDYVDMEE